jgi:DNA polymerase-4
MTGRTILHVDMDAFFAAVEQLRRPELRGRPVVVGGDGDPRKRGVVSTASYEAREFGVRSGMPLRTAYRLCPHAVFLPVDFDAYREVSERMHAILRDTGAVVESLGLDEAFLDCTGLPETGEAIARAVKDRIARELHLTASVGVGPNKLVAKIASGLSKPDGLVVISPQDVQSRLAPLPVTVLWGVGPKTAAHLLEAFGVRTVGDLAAVPEDRLQEAFGPRAGAHLFRIARGIDESPVEAGGEPKSISRERTFQVDLRRPETIRQMIRRLAVEVAGDLREAGYRAATITLKIRLAPFHTITRSRTLASPVDDDETVARVATELLDRVTVDRPVRLVGVRAAKLKAPGPPSQDRLPISGRDP